MLNAARSPFWARRINSSSDAFPSGVALRSVGSAGAFDDAAGAAGGGAGLGGFGGTGRAFGGVARRSMVDRCYVTRIDGASQADRASKMKTATDCRGSPY